jgi:putative transposase
VIYTTSAIKTVNISLRKVTRNPGVCPDDESMIKLLCLALPNISKKWSMPIRNWRAALNQFSIMRYAKRKGTAPKLSCR